MNTVEVRGPVGLALGGGGARGWAHIGVLHELAERGVTIDAWAGTSIGSLVGGFAAAGHLATLEQVLADLDLKRVFLLFAEKKWPRTGLVDGRHIVGLIRKHVGEPTIESLPVPYCAVATDIETGEEVVLDRGDLVTAIRASIAIPGMFTPVAWQGRHLVDGGLVNPLPIRPLRERGARTVIAVNLHADRVAPLARAPITLPEMQEADRLDTSGPGAFRWLEKQKDRIEHAAHRTLRDWLAGAGPSVFTIMGNTVDIMSAHLIRVQMREAPPDLLIEPEVSGIGHMEFHRVEEGIAAGRAAAKAALDRADW
jgi:NTE family protein